MNKILNLNSNLLGTVYPSDFKLPDYIRNEIGKFSKNKNLNLVLSEEYGFIDDSNITVSYDDITLQDKTLKEEYDFCGKNYYKNICLNLKKGNIIKSFCFDLFIPKNVVNPIYFVNIDFRKNLPSKYCPVEELMDNEIAVCHVFYKDISSDDNNFESGIAPLLCDRTKSKSAGKIAIWAYATHLIAQYLLDNKLANKDRIFVIGHSRLGKTALLAGALYNEFTGCCVNDSGCCGAAISRNKRNENIKIITETFPFWFTPGFSKYSDNENLMPFDQHFLMASCFPKYVFITTASLDTWADTDAQYLCAEAASVAYRENGKSGLNKNIKFLANGMESIDGEITFKKRIGPHFLSREDWDFFIRCAKNKIKNI